jgi:hypothetical protein
MYVEGDHANPVLDVTFDGYHIQDGDIIAAKPLIRIQLHDENEFLRLDDTSSFNLFLQYPSDFQEQRLAFNLDWVHFIGAPAQGNNNAVVELTPDLLEDGIYTLRVEAKDASGNISGDNDFLISFEVIHSNAVSQIYAYPNPFSTATRFAFTLTGQGTPAFYKIQILSLTGIVVKEINQDELGPLAVGNHLTEYVWDGSGDNGAQLAAGIYLYKLTVKDQNQKDYAPFQVYGEGTYLNKGWGKLVIIR